MRKPFQRTIWFSNQNFTYNFEKVLCLPYIEWWYHQRIAGLGLTIHQKMQPILRIEQASPGPAAAPVIVAPRSLATKKKDRCERYLAVIWCVVSFKDSHNNMKNKLRLRHRVYGVFLCKKRQFVNKEEYYWNIYKVPSIDNLITYW